MCLHGISLVYCLLDGVWELKKCCCNGVVSSPNKTLGSHGRMRLIVVSALKTFPHLDNMLLYMNMLSLQKHMLRVIFAT